MMLRRLSQSGASALENLPSLVVALDFPSAREALLVARKLRGLAPWMKVGLELFTAEGPRIVNELKDMGFKVFLDLKFYDIPNTVKCAAKCAAMLNVDLLTLHHAGGMRMAQGAIEGIKEGGYPTLAFAVSILTSSTPEEAGFSSPEDMARAVAAKAEQAKEWGLSGVVCSGHEARAVKNFCDNDFLCLCPGIRTVQEDDDQRRVMTPEAAIREGADFLVMGRPITKAADPATTTRQILETMAAAAALRSA